MRPITTGAVIVCALMLFMGICAGLESPQQKPLSVEQIRGMSDAGLLPQEIIAIIRGSGTVYRFRASQLEELCEEGIPDEVIDYMENNYLATILNNHIPEDWSCWSYDGEYWYGGAPFGWPHEYLQGVEDQEQDKDYE